MHCPVSTSDWNWDHVFPRSWYPDAVPQNLEKWQVPACRKCNSEYGRLEDDLLIRVGLCLDPTDAKYGSIAQKAMRAISPECGRNKRDAAARLAKRERILGDRIIGNDIPDQGIYPGLGNRWNLPKKVLEAIKIPAESIRRVNEKIIRGIVLLEDKRYIEPPFKISFMAVEEASAQPVKDLLIRHGQEYAREPGVRVQRAVAPENQLSSVYFIEIWEQFRMYGSIELPTA